MSSPAEPGHAEEAAADEATLPAALQALLQTVGDGVLHSGLTSEQGFDAFDIDEDGRVSLDDFHGALAELNLRPARERADELFRAIAASSSPPGEAITRAAWRQWVGGIIARTQTPAPLATVPEATPADAPRASQHAPPAPAEGGPGAAPAHPRVQEAAQPPPDQAADVPQEKAGAESDARGAEPHAAAAAADAPPPEAPHGAAAAPPGVAAVAPPVEHAPGTPHARAQASANAEERLGVAAAEGSVPHAQPMGGAAGVDGMQVL